MFSERREHFRFIQLDLETVLQIILDIGDKLYNHVFVGYALFYCIVDLISRSLAFRNY